MCPSETPNALENVRIADFTHALAGPSATRFLADHNAQVIKIEKPGEGDLLRVLPPFRGDRKGTNLGGCFNNVNRNKYSITINLKERQGRDIAMRLIRVSDVVIDNFAAGVMEKLGLGYETIKKEKPDLIVISMPAFGNSGPYRDCIGYGLMINALSGINDLTGFPGHIPPGLPIAYADHVAAWTATIGILAGLRYRKKTGKGCFIEIPQIEAMCNTTGLALLDFFVNHRVGCRMGNRLPRYARAAAPHGVYPCKGDDRWCAIAVFTEEEWLSFVKAIGHPPWTKDSKFATILSRLENIDELDRFVSSWTLNYTPDEVMDILQRSGVAAGAVREIRDLVDHDPQLKARGFYVEKEHPEMGRTVLEDIPFKLSDTPGGVRRAAPLLGEHNDFIFREILGMSEEEINQYIVDGVI